MDATRPIVPSTLALMSMLVGGVHALAAPATVGPGCQPDWHRSAACLMGIDGPVRTLLELELGADQGRGASLYAGGNFTLAADVVVRNIARWDGTTWSPVGAPDGDGEIVALTAFDDNGGDGPKLVAAGTFGLIGGVEAKSVAIFDGSTWAALGNGLPGDVRDLAAFDDGTGAKLYAGGAGPGGTPAGSFIARWNGATWTTIATCNDIVRTLEVFEDDTGPALAVGGSFTTLNGAAMYRLARYDGVGWSDIGGGMNNRVSQLAWLDDPDGATLVAAGTFTIAGGFPVQRIAAWNGSWWSPVGSLSSEPSALRVLDLGDGPVLHLGSTGVASWNGSTWVSAGPNSLGFDSAVQALGVGRVEDVPVLVAGGSFEHRYETRASSIAYLDESAPRWRALPPDAPGFGVDEAVYTLHAREENGELAVYVGGIFKQAGEVATRGIARWNGRSWSALGAGITGSQPIAEKMVEFDDGNGPVLHVVGYFNEAGGVADTSCIARWDGNAWSSIGSALGNSPIVIDAAVGDLGDGPRLFIVGRFTSVGGVPAQNVASWDGRTWAPVGAGLPGETYTVAVYDDGDGPSLYAGSFVLRRFSGTAWETIFTSFKAPDGNSVAPQELVVLDDGGGPALYAVGGFTTIDGMPFNLIARRDGRGWTSVGDGLAGFARSICLDDGDDAPTLVVGGSITIAGGLQRNLVKRVDGTWSIVGGGVTGKATGGAVWSLAPLGQGRIAVGGVFEAIGADLGASTFEGSNLAVLGPTGLAWIITQPQDVNAASGNRVALSAQVVVESDAAPAAFQWRHDDVALVDRNGTSGATTDTLVIAHASAAHAGAYTLAITTACGEVVSNAAIVVVSCPADIDGDGVVDSTDLGALLAAWGTGQPVADLNADGVVDGGDLALLLAAWGAC